jgi:FkbM family methyltransferase
MIPPQVLRSTFDAWKDSGRRQLARHKRISLAVSDACRRVGFERRGARIAFDAGVIGRTVPVFVPGTLGRPTLWMYSCGGKDLIASDLWYRGWTGFEKPLPDVVALLARDATGTFVDVGANTGFYALLAARLNPRLAVHCFEPFPPVFQLLEANLRLNGSPRNVTALQQALGSSSGTARLYVPLQDHGVVESSCSLNPRFKDAHSEVVDVPVTTLDEYVRGRKLAPVSLLKVDVEGFEESVLAGATGIVRTFRPTIVVEVLPRGNASAIEEFRREQGYVAYRLRSEHLVPEGEVGFDEAAWNHLLVPGEQATSIERRLARAGYGP